MVPFTAPMGHSGSWTNVHVYMPGGEIRVGKRSICPGRG